MAANLNFLSLEQKFHGQFRLIRAFHASPVSKSPNTSYSSQLTSNTTQTEEPLASTSQAKPSQPVLARTPYP